MPTLSDFDAARKGGAQAAGALRSDGAGAPMSLEDLLKRSDALTNRPSDIADPHPVAGAGAVPAETAALRDPGQGSFFQQHPNTPISETTNPLLAMLKSGAETLGNTVKGAAMSPIRAVQSLPSMPGQVVRGLAGQEGLPALLSDPSLLGSAPGALKGLYDAIGANPEMGGELLGQIAMGKVGPEVAGELPGFAERGINATGRGISAAGRAAEAGGEAAINSKVGGVGIPGLGALETVFGSHPVAGVATAAAPYALKYGGKLAQRGGAALEGLKFGAKEAAAAGDNAWANDLSARPEGPITEGQSTARDAMVGMGRELHAGQGYKFIRQGDKYNRSGSPVESAEPVVGGGAPELPQSWQGLPSDAEVASTISARRAGNAKRPIGQKMPYTSPEYDAELGRVLNGDAPPYSETGTPVEGYDPHADPSVRWTTLSPSGALPAIQKGMLRDIESYRQQGPSTPDPMQRLAARSMERFGKKYRKE